MVIDRLAERIPEGFGRPISIAGSVLGLTGTMLILSATAYGDWKTALWAALAFGGSGTAWQIADRLGARRLGWHR